MFYADNHRAVIEVIEITKVIVVIEVIAPRAFSGYHCEATWLNGLTTQQLGHDSAPLTSHENPSVRVAMPKAV